MSETIKNHHQKITVTCPIHGDFEVTVTNHLRGRGCPKCFSHENVNESLIKRTDRESKILTTERFVEKSKLKHNNFYDYSKTNIKHSKEPTIINCPIHGDFVIRPINHLNGQGCPECGELKRRKSRVRTFDDFVYEGRQIHGNRYDYTKVEYVNSITPVCIICPIHGEFWQTPLLHLTVERGCPKCAESKLEREIRLMLEENNIKYVYEKPFDWLGKKTLDFYLPEYNIAIECQGEQHFKPVELFGGEEVFKKQLQRDKEKYKKCLEHGIDIIYYANNIKRKNILTSLDKVLIKIKEYGKRD